MMPAEASLRLSPQLLLELHAAAVPFMRPGALATTARRERLRGIILQLLSDAGATVPPADLIDSRDAALDALRALLRRCEALRVPWHEIVAVVNREESDA